MIENFDKKFMLFCISKPPNESYYVTDTDNCALAQFVLSEGCLPVNDGYYDRNDKYVYYPDDAYKLAVGLPSKSVKFGQLVSLMMERKYAL